MSNKQKKIGVDKNYVRADAKCSFYVGERYQQIRCQGFEDGFEAALIFEREDEHRAYTELYCDDIKRCEKCKIYRMLYEQYRE